MLTALVDVILPVVLVAAVGVLLGRSFRLDIDTINKVSLHGFTPALAFSSIMGTTVSLGDGVRLGGAYLAATAAAGLLAAAAARTLPRRRTGTTRTVVACTIIGNNGNFGLPIALFALGQPGLDLAIIIFIASLLVMFTVGPMLLGGSTSPTGGLVTVLRMPVTWAIALALVLRAGSWSPPGSVTAAVQLLADAAVPLVLISLGLQLARSAGVTLDPAVLLAVGLRAVVVPATALGVGWVVSLPQLGTQSLLLACAMPTAVNTFMLAKEFGSDPDTAASAVALSTFVSIPLLAFVVAILPRVG